MARRAARGEIPGVGQRLAFAMAELARTGRLGMLERLEGTVSPEERFSSVAGIGPLLAKRIHDQLGITTLEELERTMKEAAQRHGGGANAKVIIRPSAIGDILIDAARSAGADVIVMGTHGRTGVRRLILGSIAEHVLRHAACPVVTVHAREPAEGKAW